ncbi:MAG TPA: hypothetical protein DET40_24500 [Lentisphaeria bacterium]|nr:MAG: hypothetical protein A2X45_22995 [Lentisphaerae bacterium GWF2_50_93]HCE46720.1 hypothetical protein [Lentisphaeria bacterium]
MLRQRHGDGKISGIADSDGFTEYEGTFLFRQKDVDGACLLETAEAAGKKSTTVFFSGYMCILPDNEGKLYGFLRELLLKKPSSDRQVFHNTPEIKP